MSKFDVFVKNISGNTVQISVDEDDVIECVIMKCFYKIGPIFSLNNNRYMYAGKQLEYGVPFKNYNIQKEATIYQAMTGCFGTPLYKSISPYHLSSTQAALISNYTGVITINGHEDTYLLSDIENVEEGNALDIDVRCKELNFIGFHKFGNEKESVTLKATPLKSNDFILGFHLEWQDSSTRFQADFPFDLMNELLCFRNVKHQQISNNNNDNWNDCDDLVMCNTNLSLLKNINIMNCTSNRLKYPKNDNEEKLDEQLLNIYKKQIIDKRIESLYCMMEHNERLQN
eukprot:TRINITY_DN137_c2_g2_i1.p1 TRINITY_DN137_c2_g2~~TRINITY_DN137_c2_g2_i1.p1  ORF type:complete len:286 (+),score=67.46 TRINITY_DN137_c2_g2_i1:38-895(+)